MPDWVAVAKTDELSEGELTAATIDGVEVLVAGVDGDYLSIGDVCTHEECSLADGEIEDGTVRCSCHGSVFDLRTGKVVEPPATEDEPVYQVRVEGDQIQVAKPAT